MLSSRYFIPVLLSTAALAVPVQLKPRQLSAEITINSRSVILGGIAYYIPNSPELILPLSSEIPLSSNGFTPLTHVISGSATTATWNETVDRFGATDDVWSSSFLGVIVSADSSLISTLESLDTVVISTESLSENAQTLPEGPYFLAGVDEGWGIYKAYRMYVDTHGAFFSGVVQNEPADFTLMSASHPEASDGSVSIAVPSRLYYDAPSEDQPLSGVRLGVKDLYDLKGLKTSMGNRAWHYLYPAVNETAVSIQRLIDLGAVVVGKTITSQFANGQSPTADWVDYLSPFNPRGDGYMPPSSSSAGAASAQGTYDWIDMNIGSDTGGSVRAPAGVTGLFGNRPSQGAIDLTGVLPMSEHMDTAAFIVRTASGFSNWGKAWYGANPLFQNYPSFPARLLYPVDTPGINTTEYPSPGFFPVADNASAPLFEAFLTALESILAVNRTTYDFYSEYQSTSGTDMYPPEHVGEVWTKMTTYEQSRNVWAPFFSDYAAANEGDEPHLDPPVKRNQVYGLTQTDEDFARVLAAKEEFQNWTRTQLLTSADSSSESCSNAILVHPIITGEYSSREAYPAEEPTLDNVYLGWNRYGISQLAGVPEVVLPLGEIPFVSPVTNTTKYSPVAVSLLTGYGCDFMLFDLVDRLAAMGAIPAEVKTGSSIY